MPNPSCTRRCCHCHQATKWHATPAAIASPRPPGGSSGCGGWHLRLQGVQVGMGSLITTVLPLTVMAASFFCCSVRLLWYFCCCRSIVSCCCCHSCCCCCCYSFWRGCNYCIRCYFCCFSCCSCLWTGFFCCCCICACTLWGRAANGSGVALYDQATLLYFSCLCLCALA
jgi:hypothetical protein